MKIELTLAVIGIWASLGCGPLAAQRFTLSGTVVDGVSNGPLAGMEVSLQTDTWKAAGDPVISDAQGRFAFGGLVAGEYILSAEGNGFGTVHYGEAPDPGWVSTVKVGADKSVVFRIFPRGGIEGVVRDEFGDPMMGASVSIVRPLWRAGRTTMANVGQKPTDDRGRYRFGNLAPGNYMVCAGGGQNTTAPLPGPVDFATRVENRYYIRTCNRAFQLAPGQHAQVDLSPLTGLTATVRGRVRNVPQHMGFSVQMTPEDGVFYQNLGSTVDPTQGTFAIRGVPPGHYRLRANLGYMADGVLQQLAAEIPVDVGGSDVDGLDLTLDSGPTVDVTLHGLTESQIDPTTTGVSLQNADPTLGRGGTGLDKDGTFHFSQLSPGRYWLSVRAPESCVESLKLGEREVPGGAFDVAAGASMHLDATVSKHCGSIQMRAVRDGEAVPDAKVVLLLNGTAKDPGELKEDFANDEGEYSFSGLTPGQYLVWAWAVQGKGAMTGPASLAAVEQQATVIEVKAGDPVHVDVPLLADEGKGQ